MHAPVELMHPPLDHPSGGNVYDRCLIEAAARSRFPLSSVVVDFDEVEARLRERATAFRIWDGLLLEELARRRALEPVGRRHARGRENRGVLLHWLPSLDPAVGDVERACLESIERELVADAALVVVPGEALRRTLQRRHPQRSIVRCEPAVREPFRAPKRTKVRRTSRAVELLTVSNLLPPKELVEMLRALASLRSLDWRWHLVGRRDVDPAYARRFDEESQRLGLKHRIVQHGALDAAEVVERMDRADLFVHPSRFESYGIALAEAAARALPTVCCRVGEAERLFRNEIDALLVPVGDCDAFTEALRRTIADASLRARFRANLASRVPARGWDEAFAEFVGAVEGSGLAKQHA